MMVTLCRCFGGPRRQPSPPPTHSAVKPKTTGSFDSAAGWGVMGGQSQSLSNLGCIKNVQLECNGPVESNVQLRRMGSGSTQSVFSMQNGSGRDLDCRHLVLECCKRTKVIDRRPCAGMRRNVVKSAGNVPCRFQPNFLPIQPKNLLEAALIMQRLWRISWTEDLRHPLPITAPVMPYPLGNRGRTLVNCYTLVRVPQALSTGRPSPIPANSASTALRPPTLRRGPSALP